MSLSFDDSKQYLGELCLHGHEWDGTGKSLRSKKKNTCVICQRLATRNWRERNLERVKAYQAKYRVSENNAIAQQKYWSKPESLEKRKLYNEKYRSTDNGKQKRNNAQKRYAKTDKGQAVHIKAITRYRQSEKGKAIGRESAKRRRAVNLTVHSTIFTEQERLKRMSDFNCCCAYCGDKAKALDHFIPVTKGGSHAIGNLIPSCTRCNVSKFNHDPEKWYKTQPHYSLKRWRKILKVLGKTEATINQLPLF
jgi:5-methylcytosine-specific restriction endonuclease McrA